MGKFPLSSPLLPFTTVPLVCIGVVVFCCCFRVLLVPLADIEAVYFVLPLSSTLRTKLLELGGQMFCNNITRLNGRGDGCVIEQAMKFASTKMSMRMESPPLRALDLNQALYISSSGPACFSLFSFPPDSFINHVSVSLFSSQKMDCHG
jgi:hypothetical protein